MFSFKKLFSSHSRALPLSFTFLFQRHLRFFAKWFVISWQTVGTLFCSLLYRKYSIIEIDHSLHCYHWMHFTKQLWEKVPITTRHNYYCSFTKPDQFFQKELRQFLFIWYGHATTKKVSHKVDETECRWAKCAPSEDDSDGTSGVPLRALSGRLRCLVVCLWASRNRTFPVLLQPRGLCDRT